LKTIICTALATSTQDIGSITWHDHATVLHAIAPVESHYVTAKMSHTVEEALDSLVAQGATDDFRLWRAEDGTIRGRGRMGK
jgi:hypothetical protein